MSQGHASNNAAFVEGVTCLPPMTAELRDLDRENQ